MVMGGLVDIAAGKTLTLETNATRLLTMSGVAGEGNVFKIGQGTVRFTGASLLSGRFEVQAGIAELNATFLSASAVDIDAGATLRLLSANRIPTAPLLVNGTLDMGGFADTVGALTGSGAILLGNGGALTVSQTTNTTASTAISDGGSGNPGSFTKSGTGMLTLSGAATHFGVTTLSGGTLRTGAANRLSVNSSLTVNSGATLDLNSFSNAAGSLAGAGTVSLGSGTLTAGGNGASTTFSGAMSGTGNLVKAGTGAMTLASALNHTGTTTVSGGELVITADNQLGLLPGAITAGKVVINAGTLRVADTFVLSNRRGGTANAGAVIEVDDGREITYSGTIAGIGFTKRGGGTATLTGVNTYSGSLRIDEGTVSVNTNAGLGYAGVIAGPGNLVKRGEGILSLSGAVNTFTGTTMVDAGTLSLTDDGHFGAVPASATPGSVTLNGGSLGFPQAFQISANRGIAIQKAADFEVTAPPSLRVIYNGLLTGNGTFRKTGGRCPVARREFIRLPRADRGGRGLSRLRFQRRGRRERRPHDGEHRRLSGGGQRRHKRLDERDPRDQRQRAGGGRGCTATGFGGQRDHRRIGKPGRRRPDQRRNQGRLHGSGELREHRRAHAHDHGK
jgi:autotransporter-associated beta strand protein